ncbi:unnamed protein product [Choristocarpus tenellus]
MRCLREVHWTGKSVSCVGLVRLASRVLSSSATGRVRGWRSNPIYPSSRDLAPILSAAGMVDYCCRQENVERPILGLDVAPTNFGIAVSDQTKTFAVPLTTIRRRDEKNTKVCPFKVSAKLQEIIVESSACGMVVGWPIETSGQVGLQCLRVLHFLRQLRLKGKVSLPIMLWDERLSTVIARKHLYDEGHGGCNCHLLFGPCLRKFIHGFIVLIFQYACSCFSLYLLFQFTT